MLRFGKLQSEGLGSFLHLCNMLAFCRNAVNGSKAYVFHLVAEGEGVCGTDAEAGFDGLGRIIIRQNSSRVFDSVAIPATVAYHFDGGGLAALAGGHHVGAGGGQGDAELVGTRL